MFDRVTPAELAQALHIERCSDGLPSWGGVASLIRQAVGRWGLSRAGTLTRYARRTLAACGYEGDAVTARVREAVPLLCSLGDAEAVWADVPPEEEQEAEGEGEQGLSTSLAGRLVAPTVPRYVRFADYALVLGGVELQAEAITEQFGDHSRQCSAARWMKISESAQGLLDGLGFEECGLDDWLGPSGVLDHLERRGSSEAHVSALWPAIERSFDSAAGPVAEPSRITVLTGGPGGLFGEARTRTGRWRAGDDAPDGRWLGCALGHGALLRPVVVHVQGGAARRMMDLFDFDEWRWALLSRGISCGKPEVARCTATGSLGFTCPLPKQAVRLRALCGVESWLWSVPGWVDTASLSALLSQRFGLRFD